MHRSAWFLAAFCTFTLGVNSGCLITRHNTNIVRKSEKLRPVQFESAEAKNLFDGKLVQAKSDQGMKNPQVFAVPFLLWYSSTDVVSDNGVYNDQLGICDTNGDGYISDREAMIYAAKSNKQDQQQVAKRDPSKNTSPDNNVKAAKSQPGTAESTDAVRPVSVDEPPDAVLPPAYFR
jgi:hypothetical protein